MSTEDQPLESQLELVVSLTGDDVASIEAALLSQVPGSWASASSVVSAAHQSLLSNFPTVPKAFFSYCLRKLISDGQVQANGIVSKELAYQVRAAARGAAA
jgi:hypothetical protein